MKTSIVHLGARREELLRQASEWIRSRWGRIPENAVILGSGLGPLADRLLESERIPVSEIPGHPLPRVHGHAGLWVRGVFSGAPVLALQGRCHVYEGYDFEEVTYATALLARLGVRRLVVTNASGSASPHLKPGDLMLINGIINLFLGQPRWRTGVLRAGPLDPALMSVAERAAAKVGVLLQRGVLAPSSGPSYETPAEIRMVQRFGGDAACMSTVPEILAAGQLGLRVLGISCITNYGSGLSGGQLNHAEVIETANRVAESFQALIAEILGIFAAEDP